MVTPDPRENTAPAASNPQGARRVLSPFGGLVAESLLVPVIPSPRTQEYGRTGTYVLKRFRPDKPNTINNSQLAAEAGCAAPAARPPRRDAGGLSPVHISPQQCRRDEIASPRRDYASRPLHKMSPEAFAAVSAWLDSRAARTNPTDIRRGWSAIGWDGGGLIEVRSPTGCGAPGPGGKRGNITRFSEGSRRRLLRNLARTRLDQLPVFLTNTYPDEFPTDPHELKRDLDNWLKRLFRQHPNAAGFWKLEMKERQSGINQGQVAPHFHLLLWNLPWEWEDQNSKQFLWEFSTCRSLEVRRDKTLWKREEFLGQRQICVEDWGRPPKDGETVKIYRRQYERKGQVHEKVEYWVDDGGVAFKKYMGHFKGHIGTATAPVELRQWVALTWAEVVGSDDPRHLLAGTNVEEIRSRAGVMYYASKYICKVDSDAAGPSGRWWGMHNRGLIPWADMVELPLDSPQAYQLMRVARHYVEAQLRARESKRNPRWRVRCGMAFFCDASWWLQRLPSIAGG